MVFLSNITLCGIYISTDMAYGFLCLCNLSFQFRVLPVFLVAQKEVSFNFFAQVHQSGLFLGHALCMVPFHCSLFLFHLLVFLNNSIALLDQCLEVFIFLCDFEKLKLQLCDQQVFCIACLVDCIVRHFFLVFLLMTKLISNYMKI